MARQSLKQKLTQGLLILDGAMGTQLIIRGVEAGTCNELLNVEAADIIAEVHRAYIEAGSDAVLTNTFGANRYALARHGLADRADQLNAAAASLARRAVGPDKYVLGDIGPTGDFLKPLGNLAPDELKQAFSRQARALRDHGVDGFIIETMAALDEIAIAIEAVLSAADGLPVFASMAFEQVGGDFRTMMGVSVEAAVSQIGSLGVDAVGFNCGTADLEGYVRLAERFASTIEKQNVDVLLLAEPNAGKPQLLDGKSVYRVDPDDFAQAAEKIRIAGAKIIGGCCGTAPPHIAAAVRKLRPAAASG